MRALVIALLAVAATASAQDTKTSTTKQGAKAPAANTQAKQDTKAPATNTQAKQSNPQTKQDTKTAAPAPGAATKTGAKAPGQGATQQDTKAPAAAITVAPEPAPKPLPPIMREAYDYDAGGRRDPFFSLLGSTDLRPTIADLKLSSVLYHPTRPIAVMRDASTNTRYTVTLGTTLGRMRVVLIRPRVVIFTIEEFGINRQDSLVLVDSAKARAK